MIIAIKDFRDKTTAKKIEDMELIKKGTLIQCSGKLAKERIESGLCIEVLNPEILIPTPSAEENEKTDKENKDK